MAKVYLITGYPGAGKTTLICNLFKNLRKQGGTYTINNLRVLPIQGDHRPTRTLIRRLSTIEVDLIIYEGCTINRELLRYLLERGEVELCVLTTPRAEARRRWEKRERRPMGSACKELCNRFEGEVRLLRKVLPSSRISAGWVPPELAG